MCDWYVKWHDWTNLLIELGLKLQVVSISSNSRSPAELKWNNKKKYNNNEKLISQEYIGFVGANKVVVVESVITCI